MEAREAFVGQEKWPLAAFDSGVSPELSAATRALVMHDHRRILPRNVAAKTSINARTDSALAYCRLFPSWRSAGFRSSQLDSPNRGVFPQRAFEFDECRRFALQSP